MTLHLQASAGEPIARDTFAHHQLALSSGCYVEIGSQHLPEDLLWRYWHANLAQKVAAAI